MARDGDHLMCMFQCDTCHFVNIKGRLPGAQVEDGLLSLCIRRAILDGFWSRESSTVKANLREVNRAMGLSERLGIGDPFPSQGPFPEADSSGMQLACMCLLRSLDAGINTDTIQFETMRKLRSCFSNLVHTTPSGVGMTTVSDDRGTSFFTSSPANGPWFRRFMQGCHKRMGDTWIPDRALSISETLHMLLLLEEDWAGLGCDAVGKLETALMAAAIIGTFGIGLWGEELIRAELGEMRKYWVEALSHPTTPHVPWVMSGRFKQVVGEKMYFQPVALRSASGIEYYVWIKRLVDAYAALGVVSGPVFRVASSGGGQAVRRSRMGDLDPPFHDLLSRVQERWPTVIHPTVRVQDEYSIRRSGRRGSTINAQNQGVGTEVIEANNGWRKFMRSKGILPNMTMVERYSDAKASVTVLIRYSAAQ